LSGELAALGGFFVAGVHPPDAQPRGRWRTLRDLLGNLEPLEARVGFVRRTLQAGGHDVPNRVAASVVQLGLLARILAPALAADALGLGQISLDPEDLWWQDDLGGAYPLSVTPAAGGELPGEVVDEFNAVFANRYAVPPKTLWGNVASGANSAARQLIRSRADLEVRATRAADAILADPRVEGGALRSGPAFRRRSCCLIYQAAGSRSAICGDCILGSSS
jgi:hypothetical protein